jgi:hypothetical protein
MQLNPLIGPQLANTTLYVIQKEWQSRWCHSGQCAGRVSSDTPKRYVTLSSIQQYFVKNVWIRRSYSGRSDKQYCCNDYGFAVIFASRWRFEARDCVNRLIYSCCNNNSSNIIIHLDLRIYCLLYYVVISKLELATSACCVM